MFTTKDKANNSNAGGPIPPHPSAAHVHQVLIILLINFCVWPKIGKSVSALYCDKTLLGYRLGFGYELGF